MIQPVKIHLFKKLNEPMNYTNIDLHVFSGKCILQEKLAACNFFLI